MLVIFIISVVALLLIYGGYGALLVVVAWIVRPERRRTEVVAVELPSLTVYLSVRNEADEIEARLLNLLDTDYPLQLLELVVISDGSQDGTADLAHKFARAHPEIEIRVVEYATNLGRAVAQNEMALSAKGEVLVATDAASRFERPTLRALAAPFADPGVGVTGGVVIYESRHDNAIGRGYTWYRNLERTTRKAETSLGILAKVDGPCVAYRRSVWTTINNYEDVDQVIILMAKKCGLRAVQVEDALCFDKANERSRQELRQRERMTRKALLSTFNQWGWKDICRYPLFTLVLICHKILRFFSPFLLVALVISGIWMFAGLTLIYVVAALLVILLVSPLRRLAGVFMLAQLGFALGVFNWLRGVKAGSYVPTRVMR